MRAKNIGLNIQCVQLIGHYFWDDSDVFMRALFIVEPYKYNGIFVQVKHHLLNSYPRIKKWFKDHITAEILPIEVQIYDKHWKLMN